MICGMCVMYICTHCQQLNSQVCIQLQQLTQIQLNYIPCINLPAHYEDDVHIEIANKIREHNTMILGQCNRGM